jgi:hypothetical protein
MGGLGTIFAILGASSGLDGLEGTGLYARRVLMPMVSFLRSINKRSNREIVNGTNFFNGIASHRMFLMKGAGFKVNYNSV